MGYSTDFSGELRFVHEATVPQLALLNTILGEDCRDHPEWKAGGLYRVDLELTEDFTGIRWNGAEKTYGMVDIVNLILRLMKEKWPDFGFYGHMVAQGEDIEDRWTLVIDDAGKAGKEPVVVGGVSVACPHCKKTFRIEGPQP